MGSKVRIRGTVPDPTLNGLADITGWLVDHDREVAYAIVKIGTWAVERRVHRDGDDAHDGPEDIPVVEILAIEPVLDEPERGRVEELYRAAYYARTGAGKGVLPTMETIGSMPQGYRDAQETGERVDGGAATVTPIGGAAPAPTSGIASPAFAGPGDAPS